MNNTNKLSDFEKRDIEDKIKRLEDLQFSLAMKDHWDSFDFDTNDRYTNEIFRLKKILNPEVKEEKDNNELCEYEVTYRRSHLVGQPKKMYIFATDKTAYYVAYDLALKEENLPSYATLDSVWYNKI